MDSKEINWQRIKSVARRRAVSVDITEEGAVFFSTSIARVFKYKDTERELTCAFALA